MQAQRERRAYSCRAQLTTDFSAGGLATSGCHRPQNQKVTENLRYNNARGGLQQLGKSRSNGHTVYFGEEPLVELVGEVVQGHRIERELQSGVSQQLQLLTHVHPTGLQLAPLATHEQPIAKCRRIA